MNPYTKAVVKVTAGLCLAAITGAMLLIPLLVLTTPFGLERGPLQWRRGWVCSLGRYSFAPLTSAPGSSKSCFFGPWGYGRY